MHLKQATYGRNVAAIALDNAHAVAFHKGLGSPLYPTPTSPSKYLNEDYIATFADTAYSKPNIAVVAEGASPDALSRWIPQFFKDVPASSSGEGIKSEASTYYGGEQRQSHTGGNAIVIAFPGSDLNASKPEVAVLAALLGGRPTIKWSTGFGLLSQKASSFPGLSAAASNLAYSDAGLLTIQLSGTASSVRQGANAAVIALKEIANGTVSKETISKAVANARFNLLDEATLTEPAVHFTGTGIVQTGKPYDLISQAKAIESVTAEKVQSVSINQVHFYDVRMANLIYRLPRLLSLVRPRSQLLGTSSSCRTLKRLGCRSNSWDEIGDRKCTNSQGRLERGLKMFPYL